MAHIFLSHSDKDHIFIDNLRKSLELQGLEVWVDNRKVRAGDGLDDIIETAIQNARAFIVVFSPNTFNSTWVLKEVQLALSVRKKQAGKKKNYTVIPLLMPGVKPEALQLYFQEETAGIEITIGTGGISEAMPRVLAALGERSVDVIQPMLSKPKQEMTELMLELTDPCIKTIEGKKKKEPALRLV